MKNDISLLGPMVKERRKQLGLTQEQLASALGSGASQSLVARLEKGETAACLHWGSEQRQRLADVLDVPLPVVMWAIRGYPELGKWVGHDMLPLLRAIVHDPGVSTLDLDKLLQILVTEARLRESGSSLVNPLAVLLQE